MRHWVLLIILAVTVAVIAYLTVWVFTGNDDGLDAQEPDGRAVPLPGNRPLTETDVTTLRFDTTLRGYRMAQVDAALRRAAYDLGYKQELIDVLEAEVQALREGRVADADELRHAREGAANVTGGPVLAEPRADVWPGDASVASAGPVASAESAGSAGSGSVGSAGSAGDEVAAEEVAPSADDEPAIEAVRAAQAAESESSVPDDAADSANGPVGDAEADAEVEGVRRAAGRR